MQSRLLHGITELLDISQCLSKRQPLGTHHRQHKVGGADNDASDPMNTVCSQPFAHGLDNGNTPSHRCLKGNHDPFFMRSSENLIAMLRQHGLVGSHDVLALLEDRKSVV